MLFLFQIHQDDSGWTYSKVNIDNDDDDDSDDDDFVAYCLTDLTIERQKNNTIFFLLSTVLSLIELRGNDEHVTPAKD